MRSNDILPVDGSAINCTTRSQGGSGGHTPEWEALQQRQPEPIQRFLSLSLSEASKRAYRADIRHFEASGGSIPSAPDQVAGYIAEMAETHTVATIQRRLAGLAKAHRAKGFDDPTKAEIVASTLRGIRRARGTARREAKALQRDDLFAVLSCMGDRPIDIRDRALLLIGFAGAFRRSELVGLDWEDFEQVRQGLVIHLRRSKTDQTGQGRKIGIPFGRTRWCPVQHLDQWRSVSGEAPGPVFRGMERSGRTSGVRLSAEAVSIVVKKRVAAAGFDPEVYSGHSLRAGLATSAAMVGALSHKIREQTGHASDAMLARYIRVGSIFTDNAAGAVL
jgi:integrase